MAVCPYIFRDDSSPADWSVSGEQLPGPKKHQAMGIHVLCDQEQIVSSRWGASENRIILPCHLLSYPRGLFICVLKEQGYLWEYFKSVRS